MHSWSPCDLSQRLRLARITFPSRLLRTLLVGALVCAGLRPPAASAFSEGTTGDVWDVSHGAIVTTSSGTVVGSSANDMFCGQDSGAEPGHTVFRDDQAAGFVHFVEW